TPAAPHSRRAASNTDSQYWGSSAAADPSPTSISAPFVVDRRVKSFRCFGDMSHHQNTQMYLPGPAPAAQCLLQFGQALPIPRGRQPRLVGPAFRIAELQPVLIQD